MSRPSFASSSLLLLAASLAAQSPPPPEGIEIYPQSGGMANVNGTSTPTRLTFGTAAGEAIAHYPKSHFEGIGDSSWAGTPGNPMCSLAIVVLHYQDQNRLTAHTYGIAMRPKLSTGGPDPNNNAAIFLFPAIPSPTSTMGTGPVNWTTVLTFTNSGVPAPRPIACNVDLFFGMILSANPNWPTSDGLGIYSAYYDPVTQKVAQGDNVAPRTGVPNLTWEINASGVASQPAIAQVLDYVMISPYSMIQVGARHKAGTSMHGSNDGFGAASLFPSISGGTAGRQDGCIVRITDNPPGTTPSFGGQYLLFLALSTFSQLTIPPLQLPGLFGSVYLGPIGQFSLGGGALNTAGSQTVILIAPAGVIPPVAATQNIKVYFQAATTRVGSPVVAITNLAGVYY